MRIRSLSDLERGEYEAFTQVGNEAELKLRRKEAKPLLISLCAVDEKGKLMLTKDQAKKLQRQDGGFVGVLFGYCLEHCFPTRPDKADDPVKNSEETDDA